MWIIIKFNKKNLFLLQKDLSNKLGPGLKFYIPKILIKKFYKNKYQKREFTLLGDYMFCFHEKFSQDNFLKTINYCTGMKYILGGHKEFQDEILDFISKCKKSENKDGFLNINFCDIIVKKPYKFISGPFAEKIFTIIKIQQNKLDILIGDLKTTISREKFLFNPI
tara:strand:- start:41 stop:538 length:498 start_codon:yes stop_codon:yes gene_type:complete